MAEEKNVLLITAHPDDHVVVAGTLLKLKDRGYTLNEIILSDAEESGMIKDGERVVTVDKQEHLDARVKEFDRASEIFGTKRKFRMHQENLGIKYSKSLIFELMKIIRMLKPEIVFIHHPEDYMFDHQEAGRIGLEAVRLSRYLFALHLGENHITPAVLCFEGVHSVAPHIIVDVTPYLEKKKEILSVYESQMEKEGKWYRFADARGVQHGFHFWRERETFDTRAEAFVIPPDYPLLNGITL